MLRNILLVLIILMTGLALWLGQSTEPITPATDAELALTIAEQTDQRYCASSMIHKIYQSANAVRLSCEISAGHITTIHIVWHPSTPAARADFNSRRLSHEMIYVHGYPAAGWVRDALSPPGAPVREMVWTAGEWVFFISSFDDTGYKIALDPPSVAETLYELAIEAKLFAELPIQ